MESYIGRSRNNRLAVLLANTRPYEGLIVTVAAAAALLWWRRREGRPLRLVLSWRVACARRRHSMLGSDLDGLLQLPGHGQALVDALFGQPEDVRSQSSIYLLPAGPLPTYRHEVLPQILVGMELRFLSKNTRQSVADREAIRSDDG